MKRFIIFFVLALFSLVAANNRTITFSNDTTLHDNFEIPHGITLVVQPGVTIRFDGYRQMIIKGLILALGTAEKPIVFTALHMDTGKQNNPAWKGVEIVGREAHGLFRHCRFEGAYRNLVLESNPVFESCTFINNHYALYCIRKAMPHVKGCSFRDNSYGVAADYASPLLLDNVITDNRIGVHLQMSSKALAGRNTISGNETDIHSEEAFGKNEHSFSFQYLWDMMLQLY